MYIKFKKNHDAGIAKGTCVKVDKPVGTDFIKSKHAEEISEDDFKQWKEDFLTNQKEKALKNEDDAIKKNSKRDVSKELEPKEDEGDLGNDNATANDYSNGSEDGGKKSEPIYHALNENDLVNQPELTEGLELGMEVEVDEEGVFLLNDSEQLILKK